MEKVLPQIPSIPVLHRAAWIVPVLSAPVANGAVLVKDGRILAAGAFPGLKADLPAGTRIADHGSAAIMPALVNAHTHLELYAFKGSITFPRNGFADWVAAFFPMRAEIGPEAAEEAALRGHKEMHDTGTALYGDITNGALACSPAPSSYPERVTFLELLGFNRGSVGAAMPAGIDMNNGGRYSTVAHSAYSVSAAVIAGAKEISRLRALPFSIHTAEHIEEMEFLQSGTGFCRELLEKLGRWDPKWTPPRTSPVRYLDSLGVLDHLTILVHAVHLDDFDREIAARGKCSICFCPRSNRNMSVGRPDIEKALSCGIPACIGTDSPASNTDLDLFAEAGFVLDQYPGIRPDALVPMITAAPAKALGRHEDFGALKPGLKSDLLVVSLDSPLKESNLSEALIRSGEKGAWKWVNAQAKS